LATPNLVAYARKFYNCPTLQYVPMETKVRGIGSHFDTLYLFDELMA